MRPLNEQVVVITGASSGIGRETACRFGLEGAKVVLAARGEQALGEAGNEVRRAGGEALTVPTDVADARSVSALADAAVGRFGRIDTWVNNAGVSVYGTVEQTSPAEMAQVVAVNLLGVMYGSQAALRYMKPAREGTIINVGSVVSERAVPLQPIYSASKYGVKGFTDAFRLECEMEDTGVNVTLIMPASMNTPFFLHARSKTGLKPRPIAPVYDPGVVAESIVYAAGHPIRDITAGGMAKALSLLTRISPALSDRFFTTGNAGFNKQQEGPDDGRDNLFEPIAETGKVEGEWAHESLATSRFTRLFEQHPMRKNALVLASAAGAVLLLRRR